VGVREARVGDDTSTAGVRLVSASAAAATAATRLGSGHVWSEWRVEEACSAVMRCVWCGENKNENESGVP